MPDAASHRGRGRQRGSALLLFPAAVLIVMVLAAIAVDTSIAFMGQRELANAVAAAANDAAGRAVDNQAFYERDDVQLDPATVESLAVAEVQAAIDQTRHAALVVEAVASPPLGAGCPWTVRVTASSRVGYVFARALPGGPDEADVHATAVAGPAQSDSSSACSA